MCDVHGVPNRNDKEKLVHAAKEAIDAANSSLPDLALTIISDALSEVSTKSTNDVSMVAEQLQLSKNELIDGNIENAVSILSVFQNS